jgi:hypothetical protein
MPRKLFHLKIDEPIVVQMASRELPGHPDPVTEAGK